jgi:hypothetical protein
MRKGEKRRKFASKIRGGGIGGRGKLKWVKRMRKWRYRLRG